MRNKKRRFTRRIIEALDIPLDIMSEMPKLTVMGNERVLVENHRGVYEYRENQVRLLTNLGILKFYGEKLRLVELTRERTYVCGKINGFEYENKL